MQEKEKYILILDKNDFNKYRKDCSFINNQENLAHKIAIGEFRIFIAVYKDIVGGKIKCNHRKIK
ncbi:hypothetical protein BG738_05850 [Campylobacter coli]|nr:hypothetical protein [Campylobacter coli]EAI6062023.1 hypothetical protein [Campylobacter coli]EAI9350750.1 hypothetical protein [Campylobacter coli]EAJ5260334.1 hypothetical protein [Campylobacter coli]EAJ7993748.1 hypothetical protein [Campylobacter coli]